MAGVPVCLCRDDEVDAAIERTNRTLSEVVASPNYVALMEHGDASTIGEVLICGSEATMEKRLRLFAEAGVTVVSGLAIGIGTTLLFHCDHVVAASDARFSTPSPAGAMRRLRCTSSSEIAAGVTPCRRAA